MCADLYVNGVFAALQDECPDTVSLDFDHASAYRCRACGEDLVETINGLCTDSDEHECPDYDPGPSPDPDAGSASGQHDPERVPLSWCNSAAVSTNEDEDSVTVSISVGDPRGAFTFTIRRVPDDADGDLAGQLVMNTPWDGMSSPHAPLTALRDGTHVIGAQYRIRRAATGQPS
jgi:hypothetical protein